MSLRSHGISDDDLKRVTAFLRIGSEALRHSWHISSEGHFDALLLGDEETLPMYAHGLLGDTVGTLRLVDPRCYEGEPGHLCRPLAFEALVAQLKWLEGLAKASPRAVPTEPKADAHDESPADEQEEPASLSHGYLYRLERLPTAASVAHDRRVLTVASLLTIRAVQLEELVAQSGLTVNDCQAALIRLKRLGALRVIAPVRITAHEPLRADGTAERAGKAAALSTGVIARLRGRLGLGER